MTAIFGFTFGIFWRWYLCYIQRVLSEERALIRDLAPDESQHYWAVTVQFRYSRGTAPGS
jgi:hypothetical protein